MIRPVGGTPSSSQHASWSKCPIQHVPSPSATAASVMWSRAIAQSTGPDATPQCINRSGLVATAATITGASARKGWSAALAMAAISSPLCATTNFQSCALVADGAIRPAFSTRPSASCSTSRSW